MLCQNKCFAVVGRISKCHNTIAIFLTRLPCLRITPDIHCYPRQQFLHTIRFRHIIIRPNLQPLNNICFLCNRRQKYNRDIAVLLPKFLAKLKSSSIRQHHIQQHKVDAIVEFLTRLCQISCGCHRIAFRSKRIFRSHCEGKIVLHHQYLMCHNPRFLLYYLVFLRFLYHQYEKDAPPFQMIRHISYLSISPHRCKR